MTLLETGILEVAMLVCFATAWPVSIMKSYKSRTAKGRSIGFLLIVVIGYLFGIANKFVLGEINYLLAAYAFNLILVMIDTTLWFRNNRLDKEREKHTGTA